MRLAQAADAVQATIQLAARQGQTQARIQLSPGTLGDIQIHLQHTQDGLVARVITAHADAASTLASSGDDLRRSLEQSGTALLRLEISSAGSDSRDATGAGGEGSAESSEEGPAALAGDDADPLPTVLTASLTGASLVNVLA